jgi:hypothetical protein
LHLGLKPGVIRQAAFFMPAPSIIARSTPTYWLIYLLVMPVASFIFNAMILLGLGGLLDFKPTGAQLLGHHDGAHHLVGTEHRQAEAAL